MNRIKRQNINTTKKKFLKKYHTITYDIHIETYSIVVVKQIVLIVVDE